MSHELISLSKLPSMPAPWSSSDPGEAWIWGDYVMILQTKPILVAEMLSKVSGNKNATLPPLSYHFAMTCFYKKHKNPHGPSSRPVIAATLEQLNYAAASKNMGVDLSEIYPDGETPIVKGLFNANSH